MVITNGIIHPVDGPVIPNGFVAWAGETITAVGPMDALPAGEVGPVISAGGAHVTPGYIDAHGHLGLFPDAARYDPGRCNAAGPVAPEFFPAPDTADPTFAQAAAAGVAAVVTGPGSANPVGGQMTCLTTLGTVLQAPAALKLALGETPEATCGVDAAGLAALLRASFAQAGDGALLDAREGRLKVHIHVHRAADIETALALKEEFGLNLTLIHGTEGHRMAAAVAAAGVPVVTGPAMTDRSRPELKHLCPEGPALLAKAGVRVALCTDHPETPAQYLPLCAALAVRGGMDPEEALAAITLRPAEILELDGTMGSLTPGKTAHAVVTPGPLLAATQRPDVVILSGKRVV